MLDRKYAKAWIKHSKSGKDYYRRTFMHPYIKNIAKSVKISKILDIGCGWGDALLLLDKNSDYVGIDPVIDFFDYIKQNYPNRKIVLKKGELPNNIDAPNNYFDLVLCCLTIHYVEDLEQSIKTIFSKTKKGGKAILVDIRDEAEEDVRKKFSEVFESDEEHIRGMFMLSDDNTTEIIHYFHKEKDFERKIMKFGSFKKTYLGETFVGYECTKD